jgi:hypothetical protein
VNAFAIGVLVGPRVMGDAAADTLMGRPRRCLNDARRDLAAGFEISGNVPDHLVGDIFDHLGPGPGFEMMRVHIDDQIVVEVVIPSLAGGQGQHVPRVRIAVDFSIRNLSRFASNVVHHRSLSFSGSAPALIYKS